MNKESNVAEAIVSMLTYRDGLLGGSVVLQGYTVRVQPFYVPSESTPSEREELLKGAAEDKLQLQEDTDYEYK